MTTTDKATLIRQALKALGWNRRHVSVRTSSTGSLDVTVKDAAVPLHKVEEIAMVHESISRCHASGEILSGGNTFVRVSYSADLVAAKAAELEPLLSDEPGETVLVQGFEIWKTKGGNGFRGEEEYCISQAGGDLNRNVRGYNKSYAARALAIVLMDGGFDAYGEWIAPAPELTTHEAADEVRRKREDAEMAEYKAKRAAEKAEQEARPKPPPPPELPKTGVGIRFNWSESGYVDGTKVFPTFKKANEHLKAAERLIRLDYESRGAEWNGGYYKTNFTVAIDGEEYTGRFDIGCDADTLEDHILEFCNVDANPWIYNNKGISDEDKAEYGEWSQRVTKALEAEAPDPVVIKLPAVFFPVAEDRGLN